MTTFTKSQISALTALLTGGEPARAASIEKATRRFIKTAIAAGLANADILLESSFEAAETFIKTHVAKMGAAPAGDDESPATEERPGDAFEAELAANDGAAEMEAAAEATTRPRLRKPVEVEQPAKAVVGIKLVSERFGTYSLTIDGEVAEGGASYDEDRAVEAAHALVAADPDHKTIAPELADDKPAPAPKTAGEIKVIYNAIDGARDTREFKTLSGAKVFAHKAIGPHPEIGSTYAVSGDGVGKIEVFGATLAELFPEEGAAPAPKAPRATAPAGDKPWFRQADAVDAIMLAAMTKAGPAKLAVFRAAIMGDHADFAELTQTQQNGVLIRSMDRLMEAGQLTRDGLIYGVKAEDAAAA